MIRQPPRSTRTDTTLSLHDALPSSDIVILDLGLPDIDGKEVVKRLREWSALPILVLSVRESEAEKVAALDAGANDYRSEEHTSELQSLMRISYAVFCFKKQNRTTKHKIISQSYQNSRQNSNT